MHAILTGIHQNKGAGAKGALGGSAVKARLSKKRRLLIARNPRDGHAIGQPGYALGAAQVTTRGDNLGQHRFGHIEQFQQLRIPIQCLQIHQ